MSASNDNTAKAAPHKWRPETNLVHGGTIRSNFGETSEALFLTQGFVYESAEECEARFSGAKPGDKLVVTWFDSRGDKRSDEAAIIAG